MNDITELVKKAASGDRAAFDSLYEQTKNGVWFTCISILNNEENAKDVMQDTYLTAFERLGTLSDPAAVQSWLNKIAANKCKNHITAKSNSAVENDEEIIDNIPDDGLIPEEYVEDKAKRELIMKIIRNALSEEQYRTIILYYFDEMTAAEIAELMDCHEKTVLYRLKTARLKIKEEVMRYEEENKDKLHAVVPFVLLTQLFRAYAENVSVPSLPTIPIAPPAPSNTLNIPTVQATAAVKTGGKTMLNTLKAKIIAGACAAAVVGGGVTAGVIISNNAKNKTDSRPAVSASANVSKPTNVSKPANNSKPANSSATESTADVQIAEWFDKPFATPAGWEDELVHTSRLWSGQMSTDTPIYYITIADVVYMSESPLTVQDVPEIFAGDIQKVVMKKFDCYNSKYRIAAADTQEITVQGYPFLKETGTIHTEEEEISAELSYIAYYGLMDFPTYEQMSKPAVWMVFAEGNDPAVLADMQKILDDTAANIN